MRTDRFLCTRGDDTLRVMIQRNSPFERPKAAARDLECDEDGARWDATLKEVAKQKPAPAPEEPE
jgi:hypothetical protein